MHSRADKQANLRGGASRQGAAFAVDPCVCQIRVREPICCVQHRNVPKSMRLTNLAGPSQFELPAPTPLFPAQSSPEATRAVPCTPTNHGAARWPARRRRAAARCKNYTQRWPTARPHHRSIPQNTLTRLPRHVVARRRPDRRPRRPGSREVPPSRRRRHAAPFRLVLLVVREPRRRQGVHEVS